MSSIMTYTSFSSTSITMDSLPYELIHRVLSYLDYTSIINLLIGFLFSREDRYLRSVLYHLLKQRCHLDEVFEPILRSGDLTLCQALVSWGFTYYDRIFHYPKAMKPENIPVFEFFISKGASLFNVGMLSSIKAGSNSMVEFFAYEGANDWNAGLTSAINENNITLVEFFIVIGAKNLERALVSAIYNKYTSFSTIKALVDGGAKNLHEALNAAEKLNRTSISEYIQKELLRRHALIKRNTNGEVDIETYYRMLPNLRTMYPS